MNLLKALATVSAMTFLSRILGFVRDTVIARAFGAGLMTDAFFVAFKIPNLLRRLFAEGAFSQAFVPILSEYKTRCGPEDTRLLVDHVAGLLALALFIVTLIGVLAAPYVIYVSAPGFSADVEKFDITVSLLRIIFPYIFFISFVALGAGILNTYSRFSVPAFTPVILNLCMIAGALWLAPYFHPPVLALAWSVALGGVLQLAFQIPFLRKLKLMPRPRLNFRDAGVWRVLKLMGPAVFGVSVGQISLLINTIFASFLITGSVSWLYFADRLMEFPTGLLGVALGTILLPSLSKLFADNAQDEYNKLLDWGLRLTLLLALPAALALALLAVPLIATLFHYGKFSALDLFMTRDALMAYSLGLVGLIMVKVLAPGFYARQNIRTPVKIAVATLVLTQLMNLAFIGPFKHAGLALSIGLAACFNATLLLYHLRKGGIYIPQPGWMRFFIQVGLALLAMGGVLFWAMGDTQAWLHMRAWDKVLYLSALVAVGCTAYFLTLFAVGMRWQDFKKRGAA